jgi:hypothetical protein
VTNQSTPHVCSDCFACAHNDDFICLRSMVGITYSTTASAVFIPPTCGEGGAS